MDHGNTRCSGVATPENKVTHWTLSSVSRKSRHKMRKSVLRAVLGRMQFTLHATRRTLNAGSRLVQAISVWLVKTRRAPSWHGRDARDYGHTTTAMHKLSTPYPPPPSLLPPPPLRIVRAAYHNFCCDKQAKRLRRRQTVPANEAGRRRGQVRAR